MEKNLSYCQICVTVTKKAFLILPVLAILVTQSLNKKKVFRYKQCITEKQTYIYSSSFHLKIYLTVGLTQSIFFSI